MAKIRFNKLQCRKTTSGGGKDDTYAKFFVDGNYHSRWPDNGDCDMGVGDEAYVDRQFEFKNSLKVELWEYDSTSSDDYMGAYKFDASERGSGTATLANQEEGDEYKLQYECLGQKAKTLRLDSGKCVLVSSGIDSKVIDAAFNLASEVSEAAGRVLAKTENPKAKLVGEALDAGAKVLMRIPELVKAINDVGGYPDQLYLTRTNQPGVNRRFWPVGEYYEIRSGQIVRFDDVRFPLTSPVDINLWEYDFGSGDDHLGSFSIDTEESLGVHVKTITSSTECSIYLVAYRVTEEEW
ncbi:hypothetical protein QUB08_14605 [Microcoleus sp. BR0-C5]|uniref:hypothetical protein n=1 Tax=Microcoleus sp. BR0-C5 TaxID=2818713 RepID=UPI002FCE9D06